MRNSTPPVVSEASVSDAVAEFLGVDAATVNPNVPLSAYGIDSLGAMQLVAALEDRFDCALAESLLTDYPDVRRLTEIIGQSPGSRLERDAETLREQMLSDSVLPEDVRCEVAQRAAPAAARRVVLTGATGFLGSSLLRALIDAGVHVVCLVRSRGGEAESRVRASMEKYGLWRAADCDAFCAIPCDLEQPWCGVDPARYFQLAEESDAVYHAAADVNWIAGYESLRSANVLATASLLRFACTRRVKRFHFVSSLSVCMAHDGPRVVTEQTDMLPFVERLPLGYAQSKCVAEALVRAAAARGLPAQIFRPALLAGHSTSGASNVDDLIAALLKGCIQLGAAPDLDWVFDAVPVDTASAAIVAMSRSCGTELETFHLRHPRPRHWRECVLWANVFGYPMQLEPYDRWLERLGREARSREHALFLLRAFFTRRVHGRTTPEHYEQHAHSRIECRRTRARERLAGITYPALDAERLDAYLDDFIRRGFLMHPAASRPLRRGSAGAVALPARCEILLRKHFSDARLNVVAATVMQRGSEHSIISEMTSWKRGQQTGLFQYRLAVERNGTREALDVVAKVKPPDEDAIEVAETTAAIVDAGLHRQVTRFRDRLGVCGGHRRELAIYSRHRSDAIGQHLPFCYGTWADEDHQEWGLLLERLGDMALMDAEGPAAWSEPFRNAAIDGLAAIHARWLGRESELLAEPWIGHVPSSESIVEMTPLWRALAAHAAPAFRSWGGTPLVEMHAYLAEHAAQWAPALDALPRTLIHNDFNSRNVALRATAAGPRLVAYDWELATIGAPQRDLAEFLCFTLPETTDALVVAAAVERQRLQLEARSGVSLSANEWQEGFRGALAHFLVSRLGLYAMVNRVRPLGFLPGVVRTWGRLYDLATAGAQQRARGVTRRRA